MIASEKALEILKGASKNLKTEILPLLQCLHMVSAEEVSAPIDVPSFDNSAMDGYAFRFSDYNEGEVLKITTEIQAGASEIQPLKKAEVARIFTGAPLPPDADTVVPQEDVLIEEGVLKFKKEIQINARYCKTGTPKPPAPTTKTLDSESFCCASTPKLGKRICLVYLCIIFLFLSPRKRRH